MINGIEGIPGSGKSYEAVAFHVLPALRSGRMVITNLPLDVEAFASIDPAYRELIDVRTACAPVRGVFNAANIAEEPAFQLVEGKESAVPESVPLFGSVWDYYSTWRDDKGRGPLFVIDECHVAISSGETHNHVVQWFKLHRHFNADVVLITQSFRDVSQPIARLIGTLIKCRKADILGDSKSYVRKVFGGYRGAVIQTEKREYKPQYFGLYKSHTQGVSVSEEKARDVSPFVVRFKWFSRAFYLVTFAGLVWAFWPDDKTNLMGVRVAPAAASVAPPLARPAPSVPAVSAPVAPPVAAASAPFGMNKGPLAGKGVHVVGEMNMAGRAVAVFAVSAGGRRLFDTTSVELEASGYTWRSVAHCMGWLVYQDSREPVTCDAPQMATGTQGRPVVYNTATGRSSAPASGG